MKNTGNEIILFLQNYNVLSFNTIQQPRRPGFNPRLSYTKDSKTVLDTSLLNTQRYKVHIKGKVEQARESSALP